MVGDATRALYALVAARLGLDQWEAERREKLDTLDDTIASRWSRRRCRARICSS